MKPHPFPLLKDAAVNPQENCTNITIRHHLCPGDELILTSAIESLHIQYPHLYNTDVDVSNPSLFYNNPRIVPLEDSIKVQVDYGPQVSMSDKRPIHFMQGMCEALGDALDIPLCCHVRHPLLYLTDEEKSWIGAVEEHTGYNGPYWLMAAASYKNDYTVKRMPTSRLQAVVDALQGQIQFVQVGGSGATHNKLKGVIDFVDKFDLRGFIRLCYHAQGAVCLESFCAHVMAAFEKPAVVLASGLFPVNWINYPTSKIITYQQSMVCCKNTVACWRHQVIPLEKNKTICYLPVVRDDEDVAQCMDMIKTDEIIHAIRSYYDGGVLTK